MSKPNNLLLTIYTLMILFIAIVPCFADSYYKQVIKTDELNLMGNITPAKTDTTEIWVSENKMWMRQSAMQSAIMDMESSTITMLDHSTKTQYTMSLNFMKDAIEEMSGEVGADQIDSAMNMIFGDFKVSMVPSEETRKFGEWTAKKYIYTIDLAFGKVTSEVWACPDIQVNQAMYLTASNTTMANMPWFKSILEEWKKVDGMPVYTETVMDMMGQPVKSTTLLIETKQCTTPPELLVVPAGYRVTTAPMPGLR